jgi:hypothetical protein
MFVKRNDFTITISHCINTRLPSRTVPSSFICRINCRLVVTGVLPIAFFHAGIHNRVFDPGFFSG